MKAIIMAGGEGTRLRPLTCDCPKPMMKIMNRPVMAYAVELLRKHGITDVAVTLGYLPDAIPDHFSDGADYGVSIRYYSEDTPLGTAGGVGKARKHLDETFIVLSGDGLTDLDITRAVSFHRRKKALATLVLKKVDAPFEYGVVMTDESQRVTAFIEKPDPSNVFSAVVNTGIYILEPDIFRYIPEDKPYDFGSDLFPELVRAGKPVFGYVMDGYWCDIGDIDAYILAHVHAMEGRIRLDGWDEMISSDAQIHPTAVIEKPCLIGNDVQIGENARIGPFTVIGPGCVIGSNAGIKRSILWNDVRVEPGAQARGCVLAAGSRLQSGAQVYESAALGSGADLGKRSVVLPGVKLWPGKHTAPCERIEANLVWGGGRSQRFAGGTLSVGQPAQAMRAMQAYVSTFKPRSVLLGRSGDPIANVMWHAAAAGAMAQGVQVLDCGVCPLPVLRHAMKALDSGGAAMVTEDRFIPLQPSGAYLLSRQQRALLSLYARQDFAQPLRAATPPVIPAGAPELAYVAEAAKRFGAEASACPEILMFCPDSSLSRLAESVCERAGLRLRRAEQGSRRILSPGLIGIHLDASGEYFRLLDHTGPLTEAQQQLFYAWTAMHTGVRHLLMPVSATRAAAELAASEKITVEYMGGEPLAWQSVLAEKHPDQFVLHFDALQGALAGLSALTDQNLTLEKWRALTPSACRQKRRIATPSGTAGYILETFARNIPGASADCGVRFTRGNGWAWLCPDEDMTSFRVVAESASAETARELCDFCEKEIRRLSEK